MALMKASPWKWNARKRDGDVARWWGYRSLSEFEELPKDDKLDVLALYEIHWKVEVINSYEANQEMQRSVKKPRRK